MKGFFASLFEDDGCSDSPILSKEGDEYVYGSLREVIEAERRRGRRVADREAARIRGEKRGSDKPWLW